MNANGADILVVEDEEAHAELIRRAFASHDGGPRLTVARDLRGARARLAESPPGLVITDWRLPDGKGTELVPGEKDDAPYPVVLMTSHGDEQVAVDAMKAGVLDYVVKSEATLADMPRVAEQALREWELIVARRRAEGALRASEDRLRQVVENAKEWIWEIDARGIYVYAGPVVESILGYHPDELVGTKHFYDLFDPEDRRELKRQAARIFAAKQPFREFVHRNGRKDGKAVWLSTSGLPLLDSEGEILGYRGVDTDITESKRMEQKLRVLSLRDDLTGLYNRRGFFTVAEQQLKMANRNRRRMLLLFADVDNMKWINDTFGHSCGDSALIDVACALRRTFRNSDIIGRIGGDEFAVLATETDSASVRLLRDRLREHLTPHITGQYGLGSLSVSIGAAPYDPENPCSHNELLGRADRLMYESKHEICTA